MKYSKAMNIAEATWQDSLAVLQLMNKKGGVIQGTVLRILIMHNIIQGTVLRILGNPREHKSNTGDGSPYFGNSREHKGHVLCPLCFFSRSAHTTGRIILLIVWIFFCL